MSLIVYQLHRPDGPINYFHSWTRSEAESRNARMADLGYKWVPYASAEIEVESDGIEIVWDLREAA